MIYLIHLCGIITRLPFIGWCSRSDPPAAERPAKGRQPRGSPPDEERVAGYGLGAVLVGVST